VPSTAIVEPPASSAAVCAAAIDAFCQTAGDRVAGQGERLGKRARVAQAYRSVRPSNVIPAGRYHGMIYGGLLIEI